jgi:hypothetical protein
VRPAGGQGHHCHRRRIRHRSGERYQVRGGGGAHHLRGQDDGDVRQLARPTRWNESMVAASNESSFVTGAVIVADSAMTAK